MKRSRRGAGASYIAKPAVAGSNPASGESCCSWNGRAMENTWADHSRRERWCCGEGRSSFGDRKRAFLRSALKASSRLFPAQGLRCGEDARYFHQKSARAKPERTAGNGTPPASQEAEAQTQFTRTGCSRRRRKSTARVAVPRNAGMAQRRVTSSVTRCGADAPRLCSIFLPVRCWPARIADQSAVRAGAGGEPARSNGANHGNGISGAQSTECDVE